MKIKALTGKVLFLALFALTLSGCATMGQQGQQFNLRLTGAQEVPPVNTQASGTAQVTVAPDLTVTGSITTTGINATAAHIHTGAAGSNGPVIVPMTKSGDNTFVFPSGAKLTPAQAEALKAGGLYLNVHSAANPGGEIRAQIR
jgi:hypothetical protein